MDTELNNESGQVSSQRKGRSRRSRSHRHSDPRIWGLGLALLITVVFLFIRFLYTSLRIEALTNQVNTVQEQLILKENENVKLKSSLAQSKDELKKVIAGRLPSVVRLEPDHVLEVKDDFIKNIVFTVVTQNRHKHYEYKLVVINPSRQIIVPKFKLLLFDKFGVQVGMDQVLKSAELAPGESRSYSSRVELSMDDEPAYFHVSTTMPATGDIVKNPPK